ncbi:hypothetical protein G3M48_000714 [Beauveria asiatica]|uniref:Integral membrane protein n=1 Tax=Beauveria asiatica TaxID=1069075 RepID=A0AAW0RZY6_9HYPO
MSEANELRLLSNWLTLKVLPDQFLLTVITLLPIVAYPFLPSVGLSGVRCELFLIWSSLVPVTLITAMRFGYGVPAPEMGLWLSVLTFAVMTFPARAGIRRLRVPHDSPPKPTYCVNTAVDMHCILSLALLSLLGDDALSAAPTWIGWLPHLLYLLIVLFVVVAAPFVVFLCWDVTETIFKFTTRQVSWWYWLPENGAVRDFAPAWSIFLATAVVIVPILLGIAVLESRLS